MSKKLVVKITPKDRIYRIVNSIQVKGGKSWFDDVESQLRKEHTEREIREYLNQIYGSDIADAMIEYKIGLGAEVEK